MCDSAVEMLSALRFKPRYVDLLQLKSQGPQTIPRRLEQGGGARVYEPG